MPDAPPPGNLTVFSAARLAQRWDVTERTVRNLVARGELAGFRVGAQIRIPFEAVQALEQRKAAA